jgi:DNA repair exonuclease SbcCD ATPase subunit
MSDDLDDRIAYLRQQRQLEGAAQTQKAADLIQAIDELQELVRTTAFRATTVQGQMQVLEEKTDALESRVQRTRSFLIGGIVASGLLGALILFAALWSSSNLKTAARAEAASLRILYADQIEAARQEGDTQLATLQSEILARRSDIEHQIIEAGAVLSEIADERDATRVALEELVDLRNRVGLELIEYRGRVIFVVPDGSELLAWRAPGLSEIASYNGRMYRLNQ